MSPKTWRSSTITTQPAAEAVSRYKLWLVRRIEESSIVCIACCLHVGFMLLNESLLRGKSEWANHALTLDGFAIANLIGILTITHCPTGRKVWPPHTGNTLEEMPKHLDPPWILRTNVHAIMVSLATIVSANRLAVWDACFCFTDARANTQYAACSIYERGALPSTTLGAAMAITALYVTMLGKHMAFIIATVTISYFVTLLTWLVIAHNLRGRMPAPVNLSTEVGIVIACALVTSYVGILVLRDWQKAEKLVMQRELEFRAREEASAQAQAACERVERVRVRAHHAQARIRDRMQIARQIGYEQAITFAAHELRNPLHAISAMLEMTIDMLSSSPGGDDATRIVVQNLEIAQNRAAAMRRTIDDISNFHRLRQGVLDVQFGLTSLTRVIKFAGSVCNSLLGPSAWTDGVLEPSIAGLVAADAGRLEQVIGNCVSHAVSRGAIHLTIAGFFIKCEIPRCEAAINRDNNTITTSNTVPFVILAVRAQGCSGDLEPARMFDPAYQDKHEIARLTAGLDMLSPTEESHGQASSNGSRMNARSCSPRSPSSLRAMIHAAGLGIAVARLMARRFCGDVLVFRAEMQNGVYELSPTYYVLMMPAIQLSRGNGESMWQLGSSTGCVYCNAERPCRHRADACPPLFAPDGRLSTMDVLRLQAEITTCFDKFAEAGNAAPAKPLAQLPPCDAVPECTDRSCGGLHILYVDDEEVNRKVMTRLLHKCGISVECIPDGNDVPAALRAAGMLTSENLQALRRAGWEFKLLKPKRRSPAEADITEERGSSPHSSSHGERTPTRSVSDPRKFDAIILDIVMKHSDGAQVCKWLRSVLPEKYPIIAATGNAKDLGSLADYGFSYILEKPFSTVQIRDALNSALVTTTTGGRLSIQENTCTTNA